MKMDSYPEQSMAEKLIVAYAEITNQLCCVLDQLLDGQ
jgi:hypothetical protein